MAATRFFFFSGLVISVHVLGMFALSPVVGWAVDRFGRVEVIVVGVMILAASCVISGVAPGDDIPLLGTGLFLLGLGWSCTLIAGSTLLTDGAEAADRPAVQGLSDLCMNVAGALGGVVAGVIVVQFSYGVLCAVAVLPVLVLAGLVATPGHANGPSSRLIRSQPSGAVAAISRWGPLAARNRTRRFVAGVLLHQILRRHAVSRRDRPRPEHPGGRLFRTFAWVLTGSWRSRWRRSALAGACGRGVSGCVSGFSALGVGARPGTSPL